MKPCSPIQELLIDYIDGHLPEGDRWRVEGHLAECAICRSRVAEERWLSGLLHGALARPPMPPVLLLPPRLAAPRRRWRRSVLAATGLAALACGVICWRSLPVDPGETIASRPIATSPAASDERQFAELQVSIEREATAAQLAMSAELLAAEPAAERYAAEALRFVAETYPETKAGGDAARRLGLESPDPKESLR